MSVIPWLVLLAPLAGAAIIALVTRRTHSLSAFISVVTVLISFVCSCIVFAKPEISATEIPWIDIHGFLRVPIGFTLDSLSKTMLVLVSGVGALIHMYSLGYMRDDPGNSRYFASLSLFMSGCPTRWKVRRRSRPSSMPRPWSRPAFTCWCGWDSSFKLLRTHSV